IAPWRVACDSRDVSPSAATSSPEAVRRDPRRAHAAALRIVSRLRGAGHQALLAGGCVRDLLLGRDPVDYDVATSATPDIVLNLFPRTFAVGAHFGVVLVADETIDEIPPLEDAP